MTYFDSGRLTRLCGNPPTAVVSAADITQAGTMGDAYVTARTGITWASTDPFYSMVQSVSEFYGSAYILRTYLNQEDKADKHVKAADDLLNFILKESSSVWQGSNSEYRSWPANSNAGPYVSNSQLWTNSDGTTTDPGLV